MEKMIAYCGLVCSECPAYLATQAGNRQALEQVAAQWSKEYNAALTAENCACDGCLSSSARLCSHCGECEIRACGIERGVINCAYCDDYGCDTISDFFGFVPQAKATLDALHARR